MYLLLLSFIISISLGRHLFFKSTASMLLRFFPLRFIKKIVINIVLVNLSLIFFCPETIFVLCDMSSSTNVSEAGAENPKTRKALYFGILFAGIISSILLYKYGFASEDVSRAVSNTNIQIYRPEDENQGCLGLIKQFISWVEQRSAKR